VKVLASAFAILLLCSCATQERDRNLGIVFDENWLTVPDNASWTLIGEWDYPGKNGGPLNYTTSIVRFGDDYIEVYSGAVVSGCCYWPHGIILKHPAENTFVNPVSGATYIVNPDGSLAVTRRDGALITAARTAAEDSFSRHWD
jgi:hypothetical protein